MLGRISEVIEDEWESNNQRTEVSQRTQLKFVSWLERTVVGWESQRENGWSKSLTSLMMAGGNRTIIGQLAGMCQDKRIDPAPSAPQTQLHLEGHWEYET